MMKKLLAYSIVLLYSACSIAQSPSNNLPYNDVHTEGYKGKVKSVTITSYYTPIFNIDSTAIDNTQPDAIMYQSFNEDGFTTAIKYYLVSGKDKQLQTFDTFIYDDHSSYTIKKYGAINDQHKTIQAKRVNDTTITLNEYIDGSNQPISTIEKFLDKDYRFKDYTYYHLYKDGTVRAKRKIIFIRNKSGALVKLDGITYKEPDFKIIDKSYFVSTFIRKKYDKQSNVTFFISTHNFEENPTHANKLAYEYYD